MVEQAEREICLIEVENSLEVEQLGWRVEVPRRVVVMGAVAAKTLGVAPPEVLGMKNWKEGETRPCFYEDGVPAQETPSSPWLLAVAHLRHFFLFSSFEDEKGSQRRTLGRGVTL